MLKKLFLFATMWGIGGLLDENNRIKFSTFLCKEFSSILPEDVGTTKIFDHVCNSEIQCQWVHWDTRVQPYIYRKDEAPEFASILVPTVDNLRIEYLMGLLSPVEDHVYF
jgi:dynein heavy chain